MNQPKPSTTKPDTKALLNPDIPYNLNIAKIEYIKGLEIYQIRDKYNLTEGQYAYLHNKASQEGWKKERLEGEEKLKRELDEVRTDEGVELDKQLNTVIKNISELIQFKIDNGFIKTKPGLQIKDYHKLIDNLDTLVKLQLLRANKPTENISLTETKKSISIILKKMGR